MNKPVELVVEWRMQDYRVKVLQKVSAEWLQYEQDLNNAGVQIALMHRAAWARSNRSQPMWFMAVIDESGKCQWGFGIDVIHRKALPGALALRVNRLDSGPSSIAREVALRALVNIAGKMRRIVRVHVETFSLEHSPQEGANATLEGLGFKRAKSPRCYEETVVIDLRRGEQQIFASLHGTARRHVRAARKHPVDVREISDPREAGSVAGLVKETLKRTGGDFVPVDWAQRISFSNENPQLSRIVGLYLSNSTGSPKLLAFAWGCVHGKCVQYSAAASTRQFDLHIPLGYALAWDLISWANRLGADVFDFGGITGGTYGDRTDSLGGTSDFKRYFTTEKVRVSNEWIFEPHPVLARAGDIISAAAHRMGSGVRS